MEIHGKQADVPNSNILLPLPSQLLFIGIIFKGTVFAFHIFDDDEADFGRSLKPWKSKIRMLEFSSLDLTFTKFHMWINDLDLERLDWEAFAA